MKLLEKEKVSKREYFNIIVAIIIASSIFSLKKNYSGFENFHIYFFVVSVALLLRVFVSKLISKKLNIFSYFDIWPIGMLLGILLAFFGFKFVAVGSFVLFPYAFGRWGMRRKESTISETGIVCFLSSLPNFLLAIIFISFSGIFRIFFEVNFWLFVSNLLPTPKTDGGKIMLWRKDIWGFFALISLILIFII